MNLEIGTEAVQFPEKEYINKDPKQYLQAIETDDVLLLFPPIMKRKKLIK